MVHDHVPITMVTKTTMLAKKPFNEFLFAVIVIFAPLRDETVSS